jgi:hypothetical protein
MTYYMHFQVRGKSTRTLVATMHQFLRLFPFRDVAGRGDRRQGCARKRESREEEEKEVEEEMSDDRTSIQRSVSASLTPYCVIRALATLAPLHPCGMAPGSRWIHRASPSLAPFYAHDG